MEEEECVSWDTLKEGLHARYSPTHFVDFFGDLTKLVQTGTIREYQIKFFFRLLNRAGKMLQAKQVVILLVGSTKVFVLISKPIPFSRGWIGPSL